MHVRDVCNCRYSADTFLVIIIVKLNAHIHVYCENQSRLVHSMLDAIRALLPPIQDGHYR